MPKKVPLVSIGVSRDGQTVTPKIGEAFDFTDDEVKELDKLSAVTKVDYYRNPVNESNDEKPASAKGGKSKSNAEL